MPQDETFWAQYGASLRPLKGKKSQPRKTVKEVLRKPPCQDTEFSWTSAVQPPSSSSPSLAKPSSLDRHLERKLIKGDVLVQARLDLHGLRQDEAHRALTLFLDHQIKENRRMLLVITGKGRAGEGVLRAQIGNWLRSSIHADKILSLRAAAPRHGGTGAFYLLLRRRKT